MQSLEKRYRKIVLPDMMHVTSQWNWSLRIVANCCNKLIFVIWMIYNHCHVDDLLSESRGWFIIWVICVIHGPYHLNDLLPEWCGWFTVRVMWMIYCPNDVDDLLSELCGWFTICVIWMIYCEKDYRLPLRNKCYTFLSWYYPSSFIVIWELFVLKLGPCS